MENKFMDKYNYTTTFLYVLYFSFLINHCFNVFKTTGISDVWQMFSISGVYFSVLCILFYFIKSIILKIQHKFNFLSKVIPIFNNYTGIFILAFVVTAHYLSKQNILLPMATNLSFIFPFHEYFILFLIGFIFFIIGLYSFKTSNHKVLGIALVIMFLNGLYLGIVWHSFTEQRDLYQDLYISSVKNDIVLKECYENKISCFKLNSDDEVAKFLTTPAIGEPAVDRAIKDYLNNYTYKISSSDKLIISYSYGNSFYRFYRSYKAIGVYNHKNHFGILDYKILDNVEKQSIKVFFNIIGVATFCWISLLFLLLSTHQFIRYYFTKKTKENV